MTIAARVVHVAEQAVMAEYEGGAAAAVERVRREAGGRLDPEICASFSANHEPVLAALDDPDMLAAALSSEPPPELTVAAGGLDRMCSAFAAFADLKGRFLLGHSTRVAELVDRAGELGGYDDAARDRLRASALLIDVGRAGVSSAVWDRPGALGSIEWERVRLHSYWTERILRRCSAFAQLAPLAAGRSCR